MSTATDYRLDWVATFLHEIPHYNFSFELTNSTFNPDSKSYVQSLAFLAAVPVVWCALVLLLTTLCLCVHCCRGTPKKKKSTTCLRLIAAIFIILSIGSVAVGFFGNEEGNKGVQSSVDAIQDTNDTLSGTTATLVTLDGIADNITTQGISKLKAVLSQHLTNQTLKQQLLKLSDEIKLQSDVMRKDIDKIRLEVSKVNLDYIMNLTKDAEFYRWLGTILLLTWQVVMLLIYIVGLLKKSKCWVVWGITLGYLSLFFVWVASGVYLGGAVGMGDFCIEPNDYVAKKLEVDISPDVVNAYLQCTDKRDPQQFSKALDDAIASVTMAKNNLTEVVTKTQSYNISKYLNPPVKFLQTELMLAQGNISSLSDTVYCGQIHNNYNKALNGVCVRALVGVSLVLMVLPIMGLSLLFVQCLAPRIWLLFGKKKQYRIVDDSDPFLPRPPPYNGYGTMTVGEQEASVHNHDPSFLEDSATLVMSDTPKRHSAASDSPPPAYYAGSFVEQYNNLGTFPRTARHSQSQYREA